MNPAFAYIYDELATDKKYERELGNVETELSRCGIEGRIARLGVFRQPQKMIEELTAAGAKNLIFVGNDQTILRLMSFLPDIDATFGYIPLVSQSVLANVFGIPCGAKAVEVVAGRLIETLDVGKMDDRYFLTEVALPDTTAAVEVGGKYRVSPVMKGSIGIRNLGSICIKGKSLADPKDGKLEIVIQSELKKTGFWTKSELIESRFLLTEGSVVSKDAVHGFIDGQAVSASRMKFSILPKKLRFITGRQKTL